VPDDRILSNRLRDALPIFIALAMTLLAAIVVAALYAGREVFIPTALAILLSFVLAPLVRLLQRARAPRGLAVVAVVLLAFTAIFSVGTVIVGQVSNLAADLPRYQSTMREKLKSLRGAAAEGGPLGRAADILQDLSKELEASSPHPAQAQASRKLQTAPAAEGAPQVPVPVEMREPDAGPLRVIGSLIAPLLHPLATTGMIIVFVIFILIHREDLRNRFIRLAGANDLQKTTAALDDAAHRLSRLLLTQLALNAGFGVAIGTGLWIIGVPSPALWGVLAGVLRFVPYIGAFIGAAFPLALAVAVDPGWSMLVWAAALFLVVEPITGHVIEPLVVGRSTGLSPMAVVLAATFWTVLWGPIGLVLATPLTVCLVVLGRHTERLNFIDVLLGDRPALSPPQIFYQRMLAGDPTEAIEQAEEFLKARSLSAYYEEIALEGLRLAHDDVGRGAIDAERQATIRSSIMELVTELASADDQGGDLDASHASGTVQAGPDPALSRIVVSRENLRPEWQGEAPVLCIAGRDLLDEGAALMLGQLFEKHGLKARVLGPEALTENLFGLDATGVAFICLSFMDVATTAHIRYAVRRARRKAGAAHVLVAVWRERDPTTLDALRKQTAADSFVTSLRGALSTAIEAATVKMHVDAQPSQSPTGAAARLAVNEG
jgi:predicted PurR-regulated permease PerM